MKKLNKICLVSFLGLLFFLILAGFCLAQEGKPLEVEYPQVKGEAPLTTKTPLPIYVRYVFNFSLMIAGFVAFGVLVLGGLLYLTSAGNPAQMRDAKERIFSGLLGLVILFSSYLILNTINPELVTLQQPEKKATQPVGEWPGVVLCASETQCSTFNGSIDSIGELNNKVAFVKFHNPIQCKEECAPEDCEKPECQEIMYKFGAVLHEDEGRKGNCAVCLEDNCNFSKVGGDGISSITVFIQGEGGDQTPATVYRDKNFNLQSEKNEYFELGAQKYGNLEDYKFINCERQNLPPRDCDLSDRISSIKVGDHYVAVLFAAPEFKGNCSVFPAGNYSDLGQYCIKNDSASSIEVLPTQ